MLLSLLCLQGRHNPSFGMQWVISSGQMAKVLKQSFVVGGEYDFPHDAKEVFPVGRLTSQLHSLYVSQAG